jgi:hypothetical protein
LGYEGWYDSNINYNFSSIKVAELNRTQKLSILDDTPHIVAGNILKLLFHCVNESSQLIGIFWNKLFFTVIARTKRVFVIEKHKCTNSYGWNEEEN